ncbi:hypothetical protein [Methanobrevibacter millerae]|uniref:Uncharacterized protein n=1 Tax=Methanobrevibacter millerae TaxID=230361 RepID=A0A0U3CIW1_9EURY|nr:hypothetical protein [Methanobrevibacter millerae]ALT69740.1 hypothetical protein sm9_1976 [Methanobrevibacter millerae]ALT69755.1 hypothetical protein sm9_1995 [Methanobrevibacter millerae]
MNQKTFTWKQQRKIKRKQGTLEYLKTKNTKRINKEKLKGKGQIERPSKKDKKRNTSLNKIKESNNKNKKIQKRHQKTKTTT